MNDREPVGYLLIEDEGAAVIPWEEARWRLEAADFYWLATVRPDGRPHVRPVLAVWSDGGLHFVSGAATCKGKNLARDAHCALTAASHGLHLVVEGEAEKVRDAARLRRVAEAYATKYGWQVDVRDGALYGDGAPTAGPPPYEVYELIPAAVFSFSEDGLLSATRWRFKDSSYARK